MGEAPSKVSVTIQGQGPRARWISVCRARVLYADRTIILVRQMGSTSLYYAHGAMQMAGYNPNNPVAKRLPKTYRFRIHPQSVQSLMRAMTVRQRAGQAGVRGFLVGK